VRGQRPSAASVIGALAIVVALTGTAVAATGTTLVLGTNNTATKTTTIVDTQGIPLVLHGKKSKPPFTVGGNTTRVPSLDLALLRGASASNLLARSLVYANPGQYTIAVPAGIHHAIIVAIGAGGAGGDGTNGPAAGGGAGLYSETLAPVTPGSQLFAVVGSGGTLGPTGSTGNAGDQSIVELDKSAVNDYVAAGGGFGGAPGAACPSTATGGYGGYSFIISENVPLGTVRLDETVGPAGAVGHWPSQHCPSKSEFPGEGGEAAGFPGAGGRGGHHTTSEPTIAATAGRPGLVMIEWLR
jgi:hypothetical protein